MKLHQCRSLRHYHLSPQSTDDHPHSLVSQPSLPSIPSLAIRPSDEHFHLPINILKSHSSSVFSLALSPNHHLFSSSSDGEVRRHNPPSNSSSVVIPAANCAVKCILILHNSLIITAHQDQKIRIWRTTDSENSRFYSLEATLPTFTDRARAVMSGRSSVKIRRHVSRTWVRHADAVSALALSSSGDQALLYSVSWDRSLKIWRTSDFRCLDSIPNAHDDAINAVATSIDGRVFTGSADRSIKVWKKKQSTDEKLSLLSTLTKHKSAVNALAVSSDGTVLYSGACDRSVLVWESDEVGISDDGSGLVVIGALRGHTKAILCLCVVGDLVCSGSADGTVRVWRRSGGGGGYGCLAVLGGGGGGIKSVAARVVVEGRLVVYGGSLDGEIRVWDIWV